MSGQEPKDSSNSSLWVAVSSTELPAKKYFKIGEVAQLVGVEPHVLRYWQTQFPQVRPQKSRSGHRLYRRRDVETLLAIRELLHVQRFTIAGAKQALRTMGKNPSDLPVEVSARDTEELPTASMHSIDAFRAISEQNNLFEVESIEEDGASAPVFAHGRSAVDGGMRDNIRPPVGTLPRPQRDTVQGELEHSGENAEVEVEALAPHALLEAMEQQLAESYQRDVVSVPYEAQLFDEISWQKKADAEESSGGAEEVPLPSFSKPGPVVDAETSADSKQVARTAEAESADNVELTTLDATTASFVEAGTALPVAHSEEHRDTLPPLGADIASTVPSGQPMPEELEASVADAAPPAELPGSAPQNEVEAPHASVGKKSARGEQLGFGFTPTSKATLEAAKTELQSMLSLLHQADVDSRRAFQNNGASNRNPDRTSEL